MNHVINILDISSYPIPCQYEVVGSRHRSRLWEECSKTLALGSSPDRECQKQYPRRLPWGKLQTSRKIFCLSLAIEVIVILLSQLFAMILTGLAQSFGIEVIVILLSQLFDRPLTACLNRSEGVKKLDYDCNVSDKS
jgi:hypothetical protein